MTRPASLLNVADARCAARRRLPRGLFEYVDRGTEDETALAVNRAALDGLRLVPRVLNDVDRRDLSVEYLDRRRPLPLVIAPTAVAGLVWKDGEVALARAAARAGIPFCVSTQSIAAIEDIAKAGAELWFQLYVWRDRARTMDLLDRAWQAGARVLVLTVDTPMGPKREYNQRNGFGIPLKPSLRGALDLLAHPRWTADVFLRTLLREGIPTYAHYPEAFRTRLGRESLSDAFDLAKDVTWADVAAFRAHWRGAVVVKGILALDDARRAAAEGIDGIVVSSHGGRNLDLAPSPVAVLPGIVEAVADRMVVMADSGVRRGSDVARYLALGARAVLVGRAPLYGLAAAGTPGADRVLDILAGELSATMAFLGAAAVKDLAARVPA